MYLGEMVGQGPILWIQDKKLLVVDQILVVCIVFLSLGILYKFMYYYGVYTMGNWVIWIAELVKWI
jgi:hypothetical protein